MNEQNNASFTAVNKQDQTVYDHNAEVIKLNDAVQKGGINEELMSRKITLAFGKAADTPQGQWRNITGTVAELVNGLSTFRKGVKNGQCMMQGEVVDGKRSKSSIQKLHVMMFDHDTGALTFDQVRDKVIKAGLWAMIWSTHSSGEPVTVLKAQAVVSHANLKTRKDITVKHACDYLKQVKGYANWVLEDASISDGKHFTVVVNHKPLEKFRTLHILNEPFVLDDNRFESIQDAQNYWKNSIENVAHLLDAKQYDKSCTDISRLMYTPARAIKSNADDFRIEVINGDFLDLSEVDEAPVSIVEQIRQKFAGGAGDREFKTDKLTMFAAKHGDMFDAALWLEEIAPDDVVHQRGDGGIHFLCPNWEQHTDHKDGETSFMVTNGSESDGFGMHCRHAGCITASGNDRLWYLDLLCQKYRVKNAMSLVQHVENNGGDSQDPALDDEEREQLEQIHKELEEIWDIQSPIIQQTRLKKIAGKTDVTISHIKREFKALQKRREKVANLHRTNDNRSLHENDFVICGSDGHKANTKAAQDAVHAKHSEEPYLFTRSEGGAVRLKFDDDGFAIAQEMDNDAWHNELSECAIWYRSADEDDRKDVPPFPAIVKNFCGSNNLPLKSLDRIVGVPIYSSDGQLRSAKGYDEATKCYINPNFELLHVSDKPSDDEVYAALDHLFEHALVDFPFSDAFGESELQPFFTNKEKHEVNFKRGRASRINALAMLLQPFVRNMIDGPTPAYHIDKSVPGTGAGYLTNVLSIIVDGREASAQQLSTSDEEIRKSITASLRSGSSIVFLDNINHDVMSGSLAAALTASHWRDRILGQSNEVNIPNKSLWILAGNNMRLSGELIRRVVPIRMDADVANPARDRKPEDFLHYPLAPWLAERRPVLVHSCHTLIQNWIANGRPDGTASLGSFDSWAAVMSGIIETAGINGAFLQNLDSYLNQTDEDDYEDSSFIEYLANLEDFSPPNEFYVDQLYDHISLGQDESILPMIRWDKDKQSIVTSIGKHLMKIKGKVFVIAYQKTEGVKVKFHRRKGSPKHSYRLEIL